MLEKVQQTLQQFNMIDHGDVVAVGVSGGADSVALLLNLCEYRKAIDFTIKVVHVNHMIRNDAMDDAMFVEKLCKRLGTEYQLVEADVEKMARELHMSTEEAGRKVRYDAMRALNANKIAVGHHKDDQAETVLLNMCRGTGVHGMKGMAPVSKDIIRPLLFVTREEIEAYLKELCQPYQTDSTNLTTDYMRNRFRHDIIPYFTKEINEKSVSHIADMAADMGELESFINRYVEEQYTKLCKLEMIGNSISLDLPAFLLLDSYIRRELLLHILEKLTPRRKDITRTHVNLILNICNQNGEKTIDLPYELQAVKSYDTLTIQKRTSVKKELLQIEVTDEMMDKGFETELTDGRYISIRKYNWEQGKVVEDNKYTKYLDYDKINCSLCIRSRMEGDYLSINEKGQKKTLKEYMINEKIPQHKRDEVVLIADGNHIMWVVDYRISSFYKIDDNTKKVVEIVVRDNI